MLSMEEEAYERLLKGIYTQNVNSIQEVSNEINIGGFKDPCGNTALGLAGKDSF